MACQAVSTGGRFLADILLHVDCQAQSIGAYGFGALSDPGSPVTLALTGLLTIFVALFGYRLILGERIAGRDLVLDVLRFGIVLTLATSWPAWRTVGYNTVLEAPGELAGAIGLASGLPGASGQLTGRLQAADDSIVILTIYGTGRLTGGASRSDSINDSFRGVALADQTALGYGRVAFLAGVIGPTAAVRLGAGILLALAPLLAALLLFAGTRDLFIGWLRALAACAIGGLVLPLIYGVQLAILEPWLRDAVAQRGTQVLTPSVPTELIVIGASFALIAFAVLGLIVRLAFFSRGIAIGNLVGSLPGTTAAAAATPTMRPALASALSEPPSRAFVVAEAVARTMRGEDAGNAGGNRTDRDAGGRTPAPAERRGSDPRPQPELLGDSFRAASRSGRTATVSQRRDTKQ
jgi:type IV secretion system protein VirB6